MTQIHNTVFISYRRINSAHARLLYNELTMRRYDCFLDYETIETGEFPEQIEANIRTRAHFLVVLTPSALQNCIHPGDWLRREIELAIDTHRNIIPLIFDGFDFEEAREKGFLPGDKLPKLPAFQGLRVPWDYYAEAIARLVGDRFLQKPIEVVLTPLSVEAQAETESRKSELEELPAPTDAELTAEEYYERGFSAQRAGRLEKAITEYSKAIELNSELADAYNRRGIAYRQNGDLRAAIRDFTSAIKLRPEHGESYYNRAVAHRANHNPTAAAADFAAAYFRQGIANGENGHLSDAINDFTSAIQFRSDNAKAHLNRGKLYFQIGKYEAARADLLRALDLQAGNGAAKAALAVTRHALGKLDSALALWRGLVERDERYKDADWVGEQLNWHESLTAEARKLIALLD